MEKLFLVLGPVPHHWPVSSWGGGRPKLPFNFFFPFSHLIGENPWSPCRAALRACARAVFCMLYICFITWRFVWVFFPSVFSSSDLETVFLTFVADKYRLVFGRGAWVGEVLSSASLAVGSKSAAILEEELN